MKLIDLDEKFNTKIAKYLEKHAAERTEAQGDFSFFASVII